MTRKEILSKYGHYLAQFVKYTKGVAVYSATLLDGGIVEKHVNIEGQETAEFYSETRLNAPEDGGFEVKYYPSNR